MSTIKLDLDTNDIQALLKFGGTNTEDLHDMERNQLSNALDNLAKAVLKVSDIRDTAINALGGSVCKDFYELRAHLLRALAHSLTRGLSTKYMDKYELEVAEILMEQGLVHATMEDGVKWYYLTKDGIDGYLATSERA